MLEQLLLGFCLLPGLALFELFLGLASLTFLLLVFLLLKVIVLLLLLTTDGLWSANIAKVVHQGLGQILILTRSIVVIYSSHILPIKLGLVVAVRKIELETIFGNSKAINNDLIVFVPFSLQLDVIIVYILLLFILELLLFHLGEHRIVDFDKEAELARFNICGRWRQ